MKLVKQTDSHTIIQFSARETRLLKQLAKLATISKWVSRDMARFGASFFSILGGDI